MTQAQRLLAFLRSNPGTTTMQIQLGMSPFIANPRARISDLRAQGFRIECRRVEGVDRFYLEERPAPLNGTQRGLW